MAIDQVEFTREVFRHLDEGGVDAVAASFTEDFEFTTPPGLASEPDTYHGIAGVRRWFDEFYEAMDDVRVGASEIVDVAPGLVAISLRVSARGRTSGIEATQRAGMLVRFRDELIARFEIVTTLDDAIRLGRAEAAG